MLVHHNELQKRCVRLIVGRAYGRDQLASTKRGVWPNDTASSAPASRVGRPLIVALRAKLKGAGVGLAEQQD